FPILELPTELVLLILRYAAEPTFSQANTYDKENPYSSALALCRVSKLFRRAALPQLLHTVLLSARHSVPAFVHALRMQKAYAQQDHHLHFEYAPHVHRIWIVNSRRMPDPSASAPAHRSIFLPAPVLGAESGLPRLQFRLHDNVTPANTIDFGLLAPVLFAAESLVLNGESLFILARCIRHAWNSQMATNIDHARSLLPWSTKTLTLSSGISWSFFHITREGSAFLASISHVIVLSDPADSHRHITGRYYSKLGPGDYRLPKWLMNAPWASFTNLQTVSLAL
ncbi:hypothetical protein DFH29DRAFT_773609, partial [Suillus ampliporus]